MIEFLVASLAVGATYIVGTKIWGEKALEPMMFGLICGVILKDLFIYFT